MPEPDQAVGSARSAQFSQGRGLVRHCTATLCRSASNSASLGDGERPSRDKPAEPNED